MDQIYKQYLSDGRVAGMRYAFSLQRTGTIEPSGSQSGRRPGSSLEFMDHREYVPGDDLRQVNWNAFARSDRLTVKLYQNEVYPYVDIILDGSRSMALQNTSKTAAALGLAALFSQASQNSNFLFSAWLAGKSLSRLPNGNLEPALWQGIDFSHPGSVPQSFARMTNRFRPGSIRILISDLLWLGEPLDTLRLLADSASAVYVVQLLAKTELDPDHMGNLRLVDSETDDMLDIFIDPSALRKYKSNLALHQQNWSRACRSSCVLMLTLCAEDLVSDWHLGELLAKGVLRPI